MSYKNLYMDLKFGSNFNQREILESLNFRYLTHDELNTIRSNLPEIENMNKDFFTQVMKYQYPVSQFQDEYKLKDNNRIRVPFFTSNNFVNYFVSIYPKPATNRKLYCIVKKCIKERHKLINDILLIWEKKRLDINVLTYNVSFQSLEGISTGSAMMAGCLNNGENVCSKNIANFIRTQASLKLDDTIDIICLQEINETNDNQFKNSLKKYLGKDFFEKYEKISNFSEKGGVMILYNKRVFTYISDNKIYMDNERSRPLLAIKLQKGDKIIDVITCHFPHYSDIPKCNAAFARNFTNLGIGENVILCGDFNHHPSEEGIKHVSNLLYYTPTNAYTCCDAEGRNRNRNYSYPFDHIFSTFHRRKTFIGNPGNDPGRSFTSDHLPVVSSFVIKNNLPFGSAVGYDFDGVLHTSVNNVGEKQRHPIDHNNFDLYQPFHLFIDMIRNNTNIFQYIITGRKINVKYKIEDFLTKYGIKDKIKEIIFLPSEEKYKAVRNLQLLEFYDDSIASLDGIENHKSEMKEGYCSYYVLPELNTFRKW